MQQLLCLMVISSFGLWMRAQTRSSSCLAAGYIRDGVIKFVGGTVQAVAVFKGNCEVLGLWLRAHIRSSSCLAAGYFRVGVVKFVGGVLHAVAVFKGNCEVLGLWLRALARSSSCLAAGYIRVGVVKIFGGTVQALLCLTVTPRCLGSGYGLKSGRQAAWRPGTIGMVSSGWLVTLNKFLVDPGFAVLVGLRASPLVRSDVHAGGARQCRNCAVLQKTRTTGRSYCSISDSPRGWSTRSWLTWCTFPHG